MTRSAVGLEPVEDRPHPLRAEQLGRVGRQRAGGEHAEVVLLGRLDDRVEAHVVAAAAASSARARSAGRRRRWTPGCRRSASTRSTRRPGLGEDDGQVGGRHGLALAGHRARHEERPDRRVDRGELDVRPERPVGLGDAGPWVEERGELVDLAPTRRRPSSGRSCRGCSGPVTAWTSSGSLIASSRYSATAMIPTAIRRPRTAARSVFSSGRGEIGAGGATAGSTTLSRFDALPDEKESSVAYVERRVTSRPSRVASSASCAAVRSVERRRALDPGLGRPDLRLRRLEVGVDRRLELRLAALDGRRGRDQLLRRWRSRSRRRAPDPWSWAVIVTSVLSVGASATHVPRAARPGSRRARAPR